MSSGWKQDYPNVQRYYIFQIWLKACAMGVNGSDNMLREVQRTLPSLYSNMSIMSTIGVKPPGGCHYPLAGWAEFARLLQPLIERDFYGRTFSESITPPNLVKATYLTDQKDAIALEFDQPVVWTGALASQFYLDGEMGKIVSGSVTGNVLTLKLAAPVAVDRARADDDCVAVEIAGLSHCHGGKVASRLQRRWLRQAAVGRAG